MSELVACLAIREVRAECLTAWARLVAAGRRLGRPVPPMARYRPAETVVCLLATAIEEGRDLSLMDGIPAGATYRMLPA